LLLCAVTLQGVQVVEDLDVLVGVDGDELTDNPCTGLGNRVGKPGAVKSETDHDRRAFPNAPPDEQSLVVALSRAKCPVDEDRMLATHLCSLPLPLQPIYRNTGKTVRRCIEHHES
jgi:hypothetical protein